MFGHSDAKRRLLTAFEVVAFDPAQFLSRWALLRGQRPLHARALTPAPVLELAFQKQIGRSRSDPLSRPERKSEEARRS